MGMYTALHFNSELVKDTPEDVINALKLMLDSDLLDNLTITHDLFKTDRWRYMLKTDSYYFDADTHSTLRFDEISHRYYLCIRCNLKNYGSEIEKFIDWIKPYTEKDTGDFLGHYQYEEDQDINIIRK